MEDNISLIPGGTHADERGILSFFNTFDMSLVKRFYIIEHPDTTIVRAWQGHRQEQKWFYALAGAFKMAVIRPDDWQHPSKKLVPEVFRLSSGHSRLLHIPGGYATGFCALEQNARLLVFSDASVEQSAKDDYRFDKNLWSDVWHENDE